MGSKWKVEFTRSARHEFKLLEFGAKRDATAIIDELCEGTFPPDTERLRGYFDYHRTKFYRGRYRMIFRAFEGSHTILVTRVRPRKIAYVGMADSRFDREGGGR
jgi:mRNA-degrading endonuclease RelE of RelBE toxin-antitoxin system